MAVYPYDETGTATTNLIEDEVHALSTINEDTFYILVPNAAPFHLDNLKVIHVDEDDNETELTIDVDYYAALMYLGATRSLGKPIYGGVAFNSTTLTGSIKLTYQTLGGDWVADRVAVLATFSEILYNPRVTVWDIVTDVQETFPPSEHSHEYDDVLGQSDLIAVIQSIVDAMLAVQGTYATIDYVLNLSSQMALKQHTHPISDIIGLQAYLDSLSAAIASLLTNVPPSKPSVYVASTSVSGSTTTLNLSGSSFISPNTQVSSTWEVASDVNFANVFISDTVSSGDFFNHSVDIDNLSYSVVYIRLKYTDSLSQDSSWSNTVTYSLPSVAVFSFTLSGDTIIIPTFTATGVTVDWGDGTNSSYDSTTSLGKTYSSSASRTVTITFETLTAMNFSTSTKLTSINSLSDNNISTLSTCFQGQTTLTTVADMTMSSLLSMSQCFAGCTNLVSVTGLTTPLLTSTYQMFYNCSSLTTVGLFSTSNVTNFAQMFRNCGAITAIPAFNTSAGLSFARFLQGCTSLTTSPTFNTANGTDFSYFYASCSSLTTVPALSTSNGTTFTSMMNGCTSLTTAPTLTTTAGTTFASFLANCTGISTIPTYDTSNATSLTSMFNGCSSLTTIPTLSTSNSTSFSYMFYGCTSLTTVPTLNTSSATTMSYMFYGCESLTTSPTFSTSNVTTMAYMFYGCTSLTTVPTMTVTSVTNFERAFYGCSSLTSVGSWVMSAGTSFTSTFYGCSSITTCNISAFRYSIAFSYLTSLTIAKLISLINRCGTAQSSAKFTLTSTQANQIYTQQVQTAIDAGWTFSPSVLSGGQMTFTTASSTSVVSFTTFAASNVIVDWGDGNGQVSLGTTTTLSNSYSTPGAYTVTISYSALTSLKVGANTFLKTVTALTSNSITSWANAFANSTALTTVSGIETTSGTNFSYMFSSCTALTSVTGLTCTSGTTTSYMFYGCTALTSSPSFTSLVSVTDATYMYSGCTALTSVTLSGTTSMTTAAYMFYGCTALTTVSLATGALLTATRMFSGCQALTSVTLSSTSTITAASYMFYGCANLTAAPISNYSKMTTTAYMYYNCVNMVSTGAVSMSLNTNASYMFYGCVDLTTISSITTSSSLTTTASMFSGCTSITTVPLFTATGVTDMSGMFSGCTALTSCPTFVTTNCTNMSSMFTGCTSFLTVPLFNTAKVTNMNSFVRGCTALKTVPALDLSAVTTSMAGGSTAAPFYNCTAVTTFKVTGYTVSIDLTSLTSLSLTNLIAAINNCGTTTSGIIYRPSATTDDITTDDVAVALDAGWTLSPAAVENRMIVWWVDSDTDSTHGAYWQVFTATNVRVYSGGTSYNSGVWDGTISSSPIATLGTTSSLNLYGSTYWGKWIVVKYSTLSEIRRDSSHLDLNYIKALYFLGPNEITDAGSAFNNLYRLVTVGTLNLPDATNATNILSANTAMTSVTAINGTLLRNFTGAFSGCTALTTLPTLTTTSMLYADSMFYNCSAITTIPSTYNFSTVTTATSMCYGCTSLTTFPLLSFAACTDYTSMFYGCTALATFRMQPNTSTTVEQTFTTMFYNCSAIATISFPGFTNDIDFSDMSALSYSNLATLINSCGSAYSYGDTYYTVSSTQNTGLASYSTSTATSRGWLRTVETTTGGGGTDSSCVVVDSWLYPGLQSGDAVVGITLDAANDEYNFFRTEITNIYGISTHPCYELVTSSGAVIQVSESTPITLPETGCSVLAPDLVEGQLLYVKHYDNEPILEPLVQKNFIGFKDVVYISLGGLSYAAGMDPEHRIYTHNAVKV